MLSAFSKEDFLAEVLLGPLWVWLLLGETATLNTLVGGAVLLAAIAGNALSGMRRKPPAKCPGTSCLRYWPSSRCRWPDAGTR